MRNTRPGAVPIVELQSRQMKTKFGMKPRPFFQVMGWRVKSDEATKLIADSTDKEGEATTAKLSIPSTTRFLTDLNLTG
jgi:hypothetical protein